MLTKESLPSYSSVIPELESFHDGYMFRVDYRPDTPREVLINDMVTYLAEYRLAVQKTEYEYVYTHGSLRSTDDGEAMTTIARNGIAAREREGKSVKKETADLLGMQKVESFVAEAAHGDTIVWASPPDPEVGYEYGFLYIGKVEHEEMARKRLKMSAVRLDDNPSLAQFSEAMHLFTNKHVDFRTVNECISNPYHIPRDVPMQEIDFILRGSFAFTKDERAERRKQRVLSALQPYLNDWVVAIRSSASNAERRKLVFTLENITLFLEQQFVRDDIFEEETIFSENVLQGSLSDLQDTYGYIPQEVIGSCDAPEGSMTSPDIFGYNSIFKETSFSDTEKTLSCTCPFCNRKVDAVIKDGRIICPREACGKSAPYNC